MSAPTRSVGPLLLRLHFYAGVLVAPFLVVAAVTGLLFVTTPQLDRAVYADELRTDGHGPRKPLAEQVAAAVAAHPEGTVSEVILPAGDDLNTRVVFAVESLGENNDTVYVDPYTARVKGSLVTYYGATPLNTWLDVLHRDLHLGPVGNLYSELAASWLWIVALGGVVLWLRRQRGRLRAALVPDLKARKGVRRSRGWHASLGLWLALGLFIISATGLTWSNYAGENFGAVQDALNGSAPAVSTAAAPDSGGGGHHGSAGAARPADLTLLDPVVATARAAGLDGTVIVTPPAEPGTAWTVGQDSAPFGFDVVAVAPDGKTVTDRVDFADWPLLAKLTKLGIYAHMGILFGLPNQLVLGALALGLLTVIFWGYRMWWQRRPTRAGRSAPFGTAPARAAWRQLPTWAIVVGVPLVVALGYALPLFGLSLVGFLLTDLVIGALQGRRVAAIAPASPVPLDSPSEEAKV
ncbi:membrane protein [Virgisporangium aliadipatigenens]|uniref:Membrane protein n=1 Tax=Virgisporangium aliadipatigenens TaxID=741659 RepID=A0A8J4DSG4_9ACTN|nr:PepSY-associated TM helix domain-containing protein [Virgisporangium aliadipatigenens]GIJ49210.1 membrane protein [Virgisporangium aliadipatigenens]